MHDDPIPPPAESLPPAENLLPPAPPPSEPPREDEDEAPPSAEFITALEEFERERKDAAGAKVEAVAGSRVRARIVSIGEKETLVDFGGRCEGVVETQHLRDDFGALRHEAGDEVELVVVQADDQVILAPTMRADPRTALRQMRESRDAGTPVTGKVLALNAGGLEVDLGGVRGFCPLSQIELAYCAAPSEYIGRSVDFLVTELDDTGHRAVLSRKALLRREEDERARLLLATLAPGAELEGTVRRLEPFGAFVDIGGVDGLVHVSEIRHERTGHPRDALTEGQKVRVKVLRIEQGKDGRQRIGLSIKAVAADPWADAADRFSRGQLVTGTVARLTDFGAFVTVAPGIDGLVHVSEAAMRPVAHVKEVLEVNQQVQVLVLSVDPVRKRISLSIREALALTSPEAAGGAGAEAGGAGVAGAPAPGTTAAPRAGQARGRAARVPAVGEVVDGFVAGIKPYGIFVDLPSLGHRVRGLVPREETGDNQGSDLARRFKIGAPLAVMVIEVKEGKIRLSLAGARDREEDASYRAYQSQAHTQPQEAPMTTMGLALRKAMEKAKEKERQKEQGS